MQGLSLSAINRTEERHDGLFSTRIRRLRLAQGMSQAEVAELAEISVRTYREWESGRTVPYPGKSLRAVAGVFRRQPGFLLCGRKGEIDALD